MSEDSEQRLTDDLRVRCAELNAALLAATEAGLVVKVKLNDTEFLSTLAGARFVGRGSPSVSVNVWKSVGAEKLAESFAAPWEKALELIRAEVKQQKKESQ